MDADVREAAGPYEHNVKGERRAEGSSKENFVQGAELSALRVPGRKRENRERRETQPHQESLVLYGKGIERSGPRCPTASTEKHRSRGGPRNRESADAGRIEESEGFSQRELFCLRQREGLLAKSEAQRIRASKCAETQKNAAQRETALAAKVEGERPLPSWRATATNSITERGMPSLVIGSKSVDTQRSSVMARNLQRYSKSHQPKPEREVYSRAEAGEGSKKVISQIKGCQTADSIQRQGGEEQHVYSRDVRQEKVES